MNIYIEFDYSPSPGELLVTINLVGARKQIDLSTRIKSLNIDFDLPDTNKVQELTLSLETNDLNIVNHPLTITKIVLDDFYQRKEFCYRGKPEFNDRFLTYTKERNIHLDEGVNDCDCLNFTGRLNLSFKWPFWQNLVS